MLALAQPCPAYRERHSAVGLAAAGPQHDVGADWRAAAAQRAECIHHLRQHVGVERRAAQQCRLGGRRSRRLASGGCRRTAARMRHLLSLCIRLCSCCLLLRCRLRSARLSQGRELSCQLGQGSQRGAGGRVQLTSCSLERHQQLAEAAAAQQRLRSEGLEQQGG